MYINKDFQTLHLIGWQFTLTNMKFDMDFI